MINLFQPDISDREVDAAAQVLRSGWLGRGQRTADFESAFALHLGVGQDAVVSTTCCTEGMFQAISAIGLGPGDEVVLPSISFIGAAHAVRASGATVVLCDVDPASLNPRAADVEAVLTSSTRAILVLHYGGSPGHVAAIAELARDRSIVLIEDAACGIGASSDGRPCGTVGDIGIWSFDAMKPVTTGDGGMVWARDPAVLERIRLGVRLGGDRSGFDRHSEGTDWWVVDPPTHGRRAVMNDLAAAIGLVQLERLPGFLERRAAVVEAYDAGLASLPWLRCPPHDPGAAPTFYWIQVGPSERGRLAQHLLEREVYTSFRYWPLHRTRLYDRGGLFPGASSAADSTLLLPLHNGIEDAAVSTVIETLRAFDGAAQ